MMRNFRGVVCEKKDKYYVFLTSEGEFLRGTPLADDPMIGAEVDFQLLEASAPFLLTRIKPKILAPVLVAAVALIFFVVSLIPQQTNAYAYVQLEGERAVEIGVDEDGQVVSLRSLDDDTSIDINKWEDLALAAVLVHAVQQVGAVQDELVITTVYEDEANQKVKVQVEQAVKEIKTVQTEQNINVKESSTEERNKANEKNTSIQKYKQKEQQPVENKTSVEQPNNSSEKQKNSVEQQDNSSVNKQPKTSVDQPKPVVPNRPPAATQKPEKEKKEHPNKNANGPKNKTHNPENKPNPNQSKEKPKVPDNRKNHDQSKNAGPRGKEDKGHDHSNKDNHNDPGRNNHNNPGKNNNDKNPNNRP